MRNKNNNLLIIFSIILFIAVIIILCITIPNHLHEMNKIAQCAKEEGCMFCLPKWVGGRAIINYVIAGIMLLISIILFFKYIFLYKK